jgi:hypothetical protein
MNPDDFGEELDRKVELVERTGESLERKVKERQELLEKSDYRGAAAIDMELTELAAEVNKLLEEPNQRLFWEGNVNFWETRRNLDLFRAEEREDGTPSARIELASNAIEAAKQAIACFRSAKHSKSLDSTYVSLFEAYDHLVELSMSDVLRVVDLYRQWEESIDEYRKFAAPEVFKPHLFTLYVVKNWAHYFEAMKTLLLEANPLGAHSSFKEAEDALKSAAEVASTKEKAHLREIESLVKGVTAFGEGMVSQERGKYREASQYMAQAEFELRPQSGTGRQVVVLSTLEWFGRWAAALHHYYSGIGNELDGHYDVAVKEYERASQGFLKASDVMPTDNALFRSLGARLKLYAEAARDRGEGAKARPGWKEREWERGKRIAGFVFFGLWLIGIGVAVIAVKVLGFGLSALMFLVLLLLAFTAAALAATLINPKEAFDFLKIIIAMARKGNNKSSKGRAAA